MTDALKLFFSSIENTTMLSASEETGLSKIIQSCSGCLDRKIQHKCSECKTAIDTLVTHNLPLVVKIAQGYQGGDLVLQDLISYGICGLFTAAVKFDSDKNVRFAGYASFWVRDEILKAMRTCSGMPVIPPYLISKVRKVSKIVTDIGRNSSADEIADRAKMSVEEVEEILPLLYQRFSIEDYEIISDQVSFEAVYEKEERIELVQEELKRCLSDIQLYVICHTYELENCSRLTTSQIAINKGITPTKVRQIRNEAIDILQHSRLLQLLSKEM